MLVDPSGPIAGQVLPNYPAVDSSLRFENFFESLYLRYDERYVYSAPDLKSITRRREWSPNSPLFDKSLAATLPVFALDYQPRIQTSDESEPDDQ